MEEILKSLLMQKKKMLDTETCPACEENLRHDDKFTRKIAIVEEEEAEIIGWLCPNCRAQFDLDNNMMYIKGMKNGYGKA